MLDRDSREYLFRVMRIWTLFFVLGLGLLVSTSAVGYGRRITIALESPTAIVDFVAISSAEAANPPVACPAGETEEIYLVGARVFDSPVRIGMARLTTCTAVGGEPEIIVGPETEVFRAGATDDGSDRSPDSRYPYRRPRRRRCDPHEPGHHGPGAFGLRWPPPGALSVLGLSKSRLVERLPRARYR